MTPLATWTLTLMLFLSPPRQNDVGRLRELTIVAIVIADAADSVEDAANLVAIAWYESGFSPHAVGKLGELGPWQLMPPAPKRLRDQAREALRRLRVQGWDGYTGESGGRCPALGCPLALHRRLTGAMLAATFAE